MMALKRAIWITGMEPGIQGQIDCICKFGAFIFVTHIAIGHFRCIVLMACAICKFGAFIFVTHIAIGHFRCIILMACAIRIKQCDRGIIHREPTFERSSRLIILACLSNSIISCGGSLNGACGKIQNAKAQGTISWTLSIQFHIQR